MLARPQVQQRPRTSQFASFPAPKAGWIANRSYAQPNEGQLQYGAFQLENWFATAQGAIMRRGSELYATLGDGSLPVTALFSYKNGNQEEFFGATENAIYDITTITTAINYALATEDDDIIVTDLGDGFGENSTIGLEEIEGRTGGDWIVTQFATSGGVFLVMVNGVDPMLIYDGTFFYPIEGTNVHTLAYDGGTLPFSLGETVTGGTSLATGRIVNIYGDTTSGTLIIDTLVGNFQDNEAITSTGGAALANGAETLAYAGVTGVDTRDLSYVWSYKNHLYFVEKDTQDFWYLAVDAISGAATKFPLGGVFNEGGSLLFGSSWSLESGDGLAARNIFVSTEGEVAVYDGLDPGDASWALAGVYRIGDPLGKQAHTKAGGDIVTSTQTGFIPLSVAIKRDYAALAPSAISYAIEDEWNKEAQSRAAQEWKCAIWPSAQMGVVALPTVPGTLPAWFVVNVRTGGWSKFTGWDATCLHVFRDQLYFGSSGGRVVAANVTGADEGNPYTASFVPLFDDLRSPGSLKIAKLARAAIRSPFPVRPKMSMQADFSVVLPPAPAATPVLSTDEWGTAIWGQSVWGEAKSPQTLQQWQSIGGKGYALAAAMQITSGAVQPLDCEIIRTDLTLTTADVVS